MDEASATKVCSGCREALPHSAFSRRSRSIDGLQPRCKPCERQYKAFRHSLSDDEKAQLRQSKIRPVKPCVDCGKEKPLDAFPVHATALDGRRSRCKVCTNESRRGRYKKSNRSDDEVSAARRRRPMKPCTQCGRLLPLSAFRSNRTAPDGCAYACNDCANRALRQARAADPDRPKKRKARYDADPERHRKYVRAWQIANPDKAQEIAARRRARKRAATLGKIDLDLLASDRCGICGDPIRAELKYPDPMSKSLDHIVPLARGGSHTQDNLQWTHLRCNLSKGAREAS